MSVAAAECRGGGDLGSWSGVERRVVLARVLRESEGKTRIYSTVLSVLAVVLVHKPTARTLI